MKAYKTYYLFLFSLMIVLFAPILVQRGMFSDGIWYATIAHNLSNGLGTFWNPMLTETIAPEFFSHPPLVFGFQSLFFDVFGSAMYVEKIYALVVFIGTIVLIHVVWKEISHGNKELQKYSFLPITLWFICERTYVNYPNNLLECTQTTFILGAVLLMLKGIRSQSSRKYISLVFSGLCLVFAFLSKGYTGLFPLGFILLHYVCFREFNFYTTIKYSLTVLLSFLGFLALLFVISLDAWNYILNYTNLQVLGSIKGETFGNIQPSRFYILRRFVESNVAPMLLVLLISLVSYFKGNLASIRKYKNNIFFFLCFALLGFLPFMISTKQASYYVIPSIPFFAFALSFILVQSQVLLEKLKTSKTFLVFSLIVLILGLVHLYNVKDQYNVRDRVLLSDIDAMKEELSTVHGLTIGSITNKEIPSHGYLMRIHQISLDTVQPYEYKAIFSNKDSLEGGYVRTSENTKNYHLILKIDH